MMLQQISKQKEMRNNSWQAIAKGQRVDPHHHHHTQKANNSARVFKILSFFLVFVASQFQFIQKSQFL